MRSILAFHMVSQIGYILLGVALFTPLGLAAGIFYLLHHMIVKSSLFLSAAAVETRYGTDTLNELKGRVGREPLLTVVFGVAALSLAGLPPFSGFFAKLMLITGAVDAGQIVAAVLALAVSLVTLMSMLKIFIAVFAPTVTGTFRTEGRVIARAPATPLRLVAPGAVLAVITLALGIGAQGLFDLATVAAAGLLDTGAYVEAVLR